MNKKIKNVCVDAGIIIVSDASIVEMNREEYKKQIFKIDNGLYNITASIGDTWNGAVETTGQVLVTTGEIIVVDPCYIIGKLDNGWNEWLDKTEYGDNVENAFVCSNMGGDGIYDVELTINKIEDKK